MSVFLLALNEEREELHIFKCMNVNEARGIQKRLLRSFPESLTKFSVTDNAGTKSLYGWSFKSIKRYTYEANRSYYINRVG